MLNLNTLLTSFAPPNLPKMLSTFYKQDEAQ